MLPALEKSNRDVSFPFFPLQLWSWIHAIGIHKQHIFFAEFMDAAV